jgi:hypothetical protein
VDTELSPRQRQVFVAIVVNAVPLDTLVMELGSSRGAIYKMWSTPGVSCALPLPRTDVWTTTLRGVHERQAEPG